MEFRELNNVVGGAVYARDIIFGFVERYLHRIGFIVTNTRFLRWGVR